MDDLRTLRLPPALADIEAATRDLGFGMASEPRTGALLRAVAASKPGGRILEIGTGTGIGTSWLLSGMDTGSSLVSVDVDATAQSVAARMLGGDTRLRLVLQDAGEFLRAQPAAFFDVVFADAMPGKYEGLEDALRVVAPGGLYVADDMLPQPNWPAGHAVKVAALLDELSADERFAFVPLAWSSGVIVAVRHNHP